MVSAECWEQSFEFLVVFCVSDYWTAIVTVAVCDFSGVIADGFLEEVGIGASHDAIEEVNERGIWL